jgi:hypothetical protein
MARRKKVKLPDISQEKVRKIWEEKFGEKQNVFTQKTPFRDFVTIAIFVNVILIAASLALHTFLPPEIPLFYGMPEGSEQLASSWLLAFPSLVALFIILVNLLIASFVEDEFIKKVIILTGIATTFFSATTTVQIMFLVGSF